SAQRGAACCHGYVFATSCECKTSWLLQVNFFVVCFAFLSAAEYEETQDVHELFDSLVRMAKQWTRAAGHYPENLSKSKKQKWTYNSAAVDQVDCVRASDVDFPLS